MPAEQERDPEVLKLAILARMADGESVRGICASDGMPAKSTVMEWLKADAEFARGYAFAAELRAEALVEEGLEIIDDRSNDIRIRKRDGEDIEEVDHEHIARSKARADYRKWMAARLAPKKYGDKVALTGGGEGDAPLALTVIERKIVRPPDRDA